MPSNTSKTKQARFWALWKKSGAIRKSPTIFSTFDPFIGCPFDDSELILVDEAEGYKKDQPVVLNMSGQELTGTIYAIGINAKYGDGTKFTAVVVKVNTGIHLATTKEIKPASLTPDQIANLATESPRFAKRVKQFVNGDGDW